MKILFLDKNLSRTLKNFAIKLSEKHEIAFISSAKENIENIKSFNYTISNKDFSNNTPDYLKKYEEAIIHGQKTAIILENLKKENNNPDLIIANSCGCAMYAKEIFSEIPLICMFDDFYNAENGNNENERLQITYNKAYFMPDLAQCDLGFVTSSEQKEKIPKCFQDKIIDNLTSLETELEKLKERINK